MGNQILYRMSEYGHFCSGISAFMCLDVSVYPEDTVGLRNSCALLPDDGWGIMVRLMEEKKINIS